MAAVMGDGYEWKIEIIVGSIGCRYWIFSWSSWPCRLSWSDKVRTRTYHLKNKQKQKCMFHEGSEILMYGPYFHPSTAPLGKMQSGELNYCGDGQQ